MFTKADALTRVILLPVEDAPTTEEGFIVDVRPDKVLVSIDPKYRSDHFLEDGLRECGHDELEVYVSHDAVISFNGKHYELVYEDKVVMRASSAESLKRTVAKQHDARIKALKITGIREEDNVAGSQV